MALTQPMPSPVRQPFGVIDPSRLRFLQSAKNQQNGITSPSLKRRLETSDLSDTENVDPASFGTPSTKRTRNTLDEDVSKTAPATTATTTKFSFAAPAKPITTNARRLQTPLSQVKRAAALPNSAPLRAPAGRSPKSKPARAFSRRSIGSYTRIDPPSFTKAHAAPRAPFSIADALHGTLGMLNTSVVPNTHNSASQTRRLQSTKIIAPEDVHLNVNISSSNSSNNNNNIKRHPKAWNFEIYTDTEQDEMANLMEHSTCVLDISDDEEKPRYKDDRGKENIPPPVEFVGQRGMMGGEDGAAVAVEREGEGASRNVEMTDEPRSALGELDVTRFVAVAESESEPDGPEEGKKDEHDRENSNINAHVLSTVDPTTIPLPPPTAQEEHSQLQDEKPSEAEAETADHTLTVSTTSSSPPPSRSPPQSQPPPPSTHTYHSHPYYPHYNHHHEQQNQHKPSHPTLASHAAISALISSSAPPVADSACTTNIPTTSSSSFTPSNEIEIWESGSAADEAEAEAVI
ncbi:hypothetical protein EMPG_13826 [Blastomyces silverae]|uniref:Uncharacterized protein n=1 Tax=Blastomyces silverae TaxID=2060906 RepID=A0A0H1BH43_9EURO|nr:hypothetical protein EMPG_13826 [Blastomyces silverae]